jgi:hypothetical protein
MLLLIYLFILPLSFLGPRTDSQLGWKLKKTPPTRVDHNSLAPVLLRTAPMNSRKITQS